jgi:hypothetical protein
VAGPQWQWQVQCSCHPKKCAVHGATLSDELCIQAKLPSGKTTHSLGTKSATVRAMAGPHLYKFPRTPHALVTGSITRDDLVLDEQDLRSLFLMTEIIVGKLNWRSTVTTAGHFNAM